MLVKEGHQNDDFKHFKHKWLVFCGQDNHKHQLSTIIRFVTL